MDKTPRPWLLEEMTFEDVRANPPEVVVLPFGATEPHNFHLPYGTDTIEANLFGSEICRKAYEKGARVACLPTVPYGTETNQQAFPLSMNVMPSTLLALLKDLLGSLERSGVHKCLLLNSHGGNEFKGHLRELFGQTKVHLFLCNWFAIFKDRYREVFENPDDHAGEMETSLILHARPELVRLERAADGTPRECQFRAVREGWITLTRPWHLLTESTGVGDPRQATAEKGRRWLEIISDHVAEFLVELAEAKIDDQFPFQSSP